LHAHGQELRLPGNARLSPPGHESRQETSKTLLFQYFMSSSISNARHLSRFASTARRPNLAERGFHGETTTMVEKMNWSQVRQRIDNGETGDKVKHPDPAAAPLGTDEEAGGARTSEEDIARAEGRHGSRAPGERPGAAPSGE